jgi:hypothetical protein
LRPAAAPSGGCVFINNYQATFSGIDPDLVAGRPLVEVFGSEYGRRHQGLDERVVESGETLRGIEERIPKCGCEDYLSKPIKVSKLIETIEPYIN